MDYEQVINVLAMEKSMCEEELRATKSKLKLYDRSYLCNVIILAENASCKANATLAANACCSSLQQSKCLFQMLVSNACCKAKKMRQMQLQMLAANASKLSIHWLLQLQANG
ncbi:hypothetical protein Tco_0965225 [Tanacetum coccineum]